MSDYQAYTIRNKTPGFRGLCVTSPNEEGPSVNLDPGEVVEVELTEAELADALATGWFERVATGSAPQQPDTMLLANNPADAPNADLGERIRAAVMMLDPDDDSHWTSDGLPAMKAVEAMLGQNISRADVEAAAPEAKRPTSD